MDKQYNYIIVGQGLAGTVLADILMQRGKKVLVIDEHHSTIASRVAAGLYNPVVFKRIVKSWMADELIPFMDDYYNDAELRVNSKFYYKKQIIKIFTESNEKEFWLKKTNEDVGKYLDKKIEEAFLEDIVHAPLGASHVLSAGNLDTVKFLDAFWDHFSQKHMVMNERFNYDHLLLHGQQVSYKDHQADKIIFCEGHKTVSNPFFGHLPFKLTKGEVLTVRIPKLSEQKDVFEKVINKGCFILPVGNDLFKVGATYEWNDLSEQPTEKGKNELIEKLKKVLKVPFDILEHKAGVRPTVSDRRPILGLHPERHNVAIFNGLGTKGVMLAPYFADHFAGFLEGKNNLDKEVDIARFK